MTPLERFMLSLSTAIVGLSGLVCAVMKYLMTPVDPYAVVNHPLQPWVLDTHVLAAPLMIFAIGLIAQDHILAQVRKRQNGKGRLSGLLALWCLLPMLSTGYLIQVTTNESLRYAFVVIHLSTGGLYLILFAAHLIISRQAAARRREATALAAAEGLATNGWMRQRGGVLGESDPAGRTT